MRHAILLAVASLSVVIAGCGQSASVEPISTTNIVGSASPSEVASLTTEDDVAMALNADLHACTMLEQEAYPTYLEKPSVDYYRGPWCAADDAGTTFVWLYQAPPRSKLSSEEIHQDVLIDAESLVLDLQAMGFQRVCGILTPGNKVDIGLEKPSETVRIGVREQSFGEQKPEELLIVSLQQAQRTAPLADDAPEIPCPRST